MSSCISGQATVKRRKKSTAAPNPKKMFEESQMVRRVKAYLNNLHVEINEVKLHEMSLECEPAASSGSTGVGIQRSKRHASPAPSTTSSTSSASDERKPSAKFGIYILLNIYFFIHEILVSENYIEKSFYILTFIYLVFRVHRRIIKQLKIIWVMIFF